MAINAPASLGKVVGEFGYGILSSQTFITGSSTVTAPANARAVRIIAWGGGGTGAHSEDNYSSGGGGGGFYIAYVKVTGGSTSVSYSVGAAGNQSTVTINGISYNAFAGQTGSGLAGGLGGTTSITGGSAFFSFFENGGAGDYDPSGSGYAVGGDAGGQDYGGGAGNGGAPGGGGRVYGGSTPPGGRGEIQLDWLGSALSEYTRTGGLIPNHSQNSNVPTTTSNLSVSNFNDAGLNFTAEVTSDGNSGFNTGSYGSINRDQFGINRNNSDQRTVMAIWETRGLWYDLLGSPAGYAYYLHAQLSGNTTSAALGRDLITQITVNGITASVGATHSGGVTTYTQGFPRLLGFYDGWAFTNGTGNYVELDYYVPLYSLYQSTTTITSGTANFVGSGTPITTPSDANFATIKVWGGGGGGAGGTGGGGGGFTTVSIDVVPGTTQFYYNVESGGTFSAPGYNGGNASISLVGEILTSLTGYGGNADGTGGSFNTGFGGDWWLIASFESGSNASGGSGGNAGGLSYGGGLGGEYGGGGAGPSGQAPGGGGSIGYAGGGARIEIDWYLKLPIIASY